MIYNKLVRDKIPEIIHADGKICEFYVASDSEYRDKLYEKLIEELGEFRDDPCYEEAADIWEAFSSICRLHNLEFAEVVKIAYLKSQQRGSFRDKLVLTSVTDHT